MPSSPSNLNFDRNFDPQTGLPVEIAPGIVRVTAPNSGPYTFTGTNSFLLGKDGLAVVDPGPDDDAHLQALLDAIGTRPVQAILLTHTHKDHSSLAARLAAITGAPIWFGGKHRLSRRNRLFEINPISRSCDWALVPDRELLDGENLVLGGITLEVVATPGHCANHLMFGIKDTPFVLTGDHVMGWNSTLVAVPDGSMGDYFASLDKLINMPWQHYLPAHGGPITAGLDYATKLKSHRQRRNEQILEALSGRARTLGQLCALIYPDLPPGVQIAARMTLQAHLEFLEQSRLIVSRLSLSGRQYGLAS